MRASKNISLKYYFGLFILSFLFFYSCSEEDPPSVEEFNLNIQGTVIDSENLFPISNAEVKLVQKFEHPWSGTFYAGLQIVTTNENGEYKFVPQSVIYCAVRKISISVYKSGYVPLHNIDCNLICVEDVQVCDIELDRSNR